MTAPALERRPEGSERESDETGTNGADHSSNPSVGLDALA
jgi:hypothetical protein